MAEQWRFLNLGYVDPVSYWTYPEAVMRAKAESEIPNTLAVSIPTKRTVNIGYYQDIDKEVNVPLCKEMDVEIVRRFGFGGGGILYDQDSRLYHIIVDSDRFPKDYEELMTYSSKGLLNAVQNLGIEVNFVPINDVISASGKKIGMCSSFRTDYPNVTYITVSLHRTVDIELAMKLITPPAEKFQDKVAKSIRDRITTVNDELGTIVSSEDLLNATKMGFEKAYGITLYDGELTSQEKEFYKKSIKRNMTRQFLYKYSEGEKFGSDLDRVKNGELKRSEFIYKGKKLIRVVSLTKGDIIENVMISGDYYAYPWNMTDHMEAKLKGCKIDFGEIRKRIKGAFEELNGEVALISPEEFIKTVIGSLDVD
jgi:lipoate-protein ligase A